MIMARTVVQFSYHYVYANFGVGDYKTAILWINTIIEAQLDQDLQDVYCFTHILHILCHYETGNFTLKNSGLRKSYRYLYNNTRIFEVERLVLGAIRTLIRNPNAQNKQQFFSEELTRLKQLYQNPLERNAQNYFDFISWLQSKIENRPFMDLVKINREIEVQSLNRIDTAANS
jgi:hypothetical protein